MRPMIGAGKALLIGIDHYRHFPEFSLNGAHRDARRLAEHLVAERGFQAADVEVLGDSAASRQGIRQALARLLDRSREDDCVVFFFAGHGTRRWLPERHRADDYLSCIVPADSAHRGTAPNLDITGEELSAWLRQLKRITTNVVLIFDSCHSGALVRKAELTVRWLDPDLREGRDELDDWPWPIEILDHAQRGTGSWLPRSRSHTVLAACRSSESARELNAAEAATAGGAFTHHLLEQLSRSDAETTYRDLMEAVRLEFRGRSRDQNPQVEGAADRRLFRLDELPPMRFVPVLGRDGDRVEIGGGAVHRVTRNSTWQVYPPATKSPASSPSLGTLRVTALDSTRSEAKVLSERRLDAVASGCRAVLSEPGDDWLPMAVYLASSALGPELTAELEAAIERSPWLSRAPSTADNELTVTTTTPAGTDRPSLAISDSEGLPCAPYRAVRSAAVVPTAVENLEKRARYARTLSLKNPGDSLLTGKIRMSIHRRDAGHGWIPAVPRGPFGMADFYDGEDFSLELANLHDEPVFLYVLDFGIGGGIQLIYPEVDSLWEPILPGHAVRTGHRMNEELTFYVPESYPFENPGASASGIETLKLFATLEATDFRTVFQDSLRRVWDPRDLSRCDDFGEILGRLFLGIEDREVRRRRSRRDLPWTTLEMPLLLIRQELQP